MTTLEQTLREWLEDTLTRAHHKQAVVELGEFIPELAKKLEAREREIRIDELKSVLATSGFPRPKHLNMIANRIYRLEALSDQKEKP